MALRVDLDDVRTEEWGYKYSNKESESTKKLVEMDSG